MTAVQPASGRIAPWGWPLIAMRLMAMLAMLIACTALYYIAAPFTSRNPVPRGFLRSIVAIAGVRLRVRGTHPARRTFFLANHVSWIDIPAVAGLTGSAFVAHDGLAQIGPLRWLCGMNDTVFIARHERRSVAAQADQVRSALRNASALTIFPEGTTSSGDETLAFKSSLLSALEDDADAAPIPVQPIWLDYGAESRDIAWVDAEPGLDNAFRILARLRPVELTVHFLPPLGPEDRADRKRMAAAARAAIDAAREGRS
ncbi:MULTISPECIES: 1-acyl-sn-glycerol-3-phosphate acyltransferase [unclassified Novosphingobium]|uniref:lysophospholipid acyltransferase family protein n=1 Tax=unclassified Novosphingobium TaxID=2644732 RepID=UPI001F1F75E8|nr:MULTISPECIES: lysophospholipid acyltransferase family protein [unclassified Novosphingobium]